MVLGASEITANLYCNCILGIGFFISDPTFEKIPGPDPTLEKKKVPDLTPQKKLDPTLVKSQIPPNVYPIEFTILFFIASKRYIRVLYNTECPKIYRKSVLHLLKYRFKQI